MRRSLAVALVALATACASTPELDPSLPPARAYHARGLELLGQGRLSEALDAFDEALDEDGSNLDAIRARIDVLRRLGRLPGELPELEERARAAKDDPVPHYALGIARFAVGAAQLEPALASLREAARLGGRNPEFSLRLGVALLEAERHEEALPHLKAAVELEPGRARSYLPYGLCLAKLGQRKEALAALSELLRHDPDPRDVQLAARAVARMYDPFRTFPQLLGKDLEEAMLWVERADAPRQALDRIELMLEQFPDQAVLHRLAGLCYERLDDGGRAIEAFRRAMELAPDDPMPHQHLADLYHTKERYSLAAEGYQAALARDPFNLPARRRLGTYALDRGNAPEAARHLEVAVWLVPESAPDRIQLAKALTLSGELERATAELTFVTEHDEKNLEALMQLGATLLERRSRSKDASERRHLSARAAGAFEKVLDAQPENAAAARLLASARAE